MARSERGGSVGRGNRVKPLTWLTHSAREHARLGAPVTIAPLAGAGVVISAPGVAYRIPVAVVLRRTGRVTPVVPGRCADGPRLPGRVGRGVDEAGLALARHSTVIHNVDVAVGVR